MTSTVRTMSDRVADALRGDIISGELASGERLTESGLALRYETSRVPVREALRILETEGFVVVRPHRGAAVAAIGAKEARGLLDVRMALEVLVAREAASHRTDVQAAEMRDLAAEGMDLVASGRTAELVVLNTKFHTMVVDAADNVVAGQLLAQLQRKIEWVYAWQLRRRAGDSWQEHIDIAEAISRRDAVHAELLVGAHIHNAQRALLKVE